MSDAAEDLYEDDVEDSEEVEQADPIRETFDAAVSGDSAEDDVKLAMIQAGATFSNVTRLYNQYMIDSGLAMSKEDRNSVMDNILTGKSLDTEETLTDAIVSVVNEVTGVTDKSASAMVRAWAKKNEVECFKRPKGSGAVRNPFVQNFHNALIENPHLTKEELQNIINGLPAEQQSNPQRWFTQHDNIRKVVNTIATNNGI